MGFCNKRHARPPPHHRKKRFTQIMQLEELNYLSLCCNMLHKLLKKRHIIISDGLMNSCNYHVSCRSFNLTIEIVVLIKQYSFSPHYSADIMIPRNPAHAVIYLFLTTNTLQKAQVGQNVQHLFKGCSNRADQEKYSFYFLFFCRDSDLSLVNAFNSQFSIC